MYTYIYIYIYVCVGPDASQLRPSFKTVRRVV